MNEDAYTDEVVEAPEPTQWHWSFLVMRSLCLAANTANAFRAFFGEVAGDVGSYAHYQMQRDEFAASAGRELETLLAEPGEGPEED